MNNIHFKGIMPALITPFYDNGKVKKNIVKELMDWQLNEGVDGFYVCGGTGEGPVISDSTRKEMAETAIEANAQRGKIIVHVGAFDTKQAIELTRHATKIGADGISSLPPTFYFDYTDDEIVDYYSKLSDNTDLPILMYATTSIKSKNLNQLLKRLMKIKNIVGLKDTRCNFYEMWNAKQINNGDINVINGPDEMLICGLCMGADGGIGSTYNVMPEKFVKLYKLFSEGHLEEARIVQNEINRIVKVLIKHGVNGVVNSVKCSLELSGYDVGKAAYPAKTYTYEEKSALKADMKANGYKY